jgi:hypothetical protein
MKKILSRVLFLGLVSSIGFMSSCEKESFEPAPPPNPNDTSTTPDTVSFSLVIQPFFDGSCVTNCHNGGGIPLNLTAGLSYDALINGDYVNVADPPSSNLYVKISVGSMKDYSSSADNANVLKWITEGAKNN